MFGFVQKYKDFQSIVKSLNTLNSMLDEIIKNLENGCNPSGMKEDLVMCAFFFRRDISNVLESYGENWNGDVKFILPSVGNIRITLNQAIAIIGVKTSEASEAIGISSLINDIIEGGKSYSSVEEMIPKELRNLK